MPPRLNEKGRVQDHRFVLRDGGREFFPDKPFQRRMHDLIQGFQRGRISEDNLAQPRAINPAG